MQFSVRIHGTSNSIRDRQPDQGSKINDRRCRDRNEERS